MRATAWLWVGLAGVAWGCSATSGRQDGAPVAGSAGSSGGNAGSSAGSGGSGSGGVGSGSAGRSGTGGSGTGSSCDQLEQASSAVIAEVVASADLSCADDDECEHVSNSTDCHAACGALVGPLGKAAIEAAIADENADRCAQFVAMGCVALVPPCVPPPLGIRCRAGRCTSDDEEPAAGEGGGASDAGTPTDGCFDQPLTFGWQGGFVAFSDVLTLSPCRSFALQRTGAGDPAADATCQNEVAADARIGVDAIDAALAEPVVQAAFADAPTLFGADTRPVDGSVYRIELEGKAIEVGQRCSAGGGLGGPCTEIPIEISELVSLLQELSAQQQALPNCDHLP